MKRIELILFFFISFTVLSLCNQKIENKKPNFIVFFADDLGYGDLTYLSINNTRKPANTPNIDYLANNGAIFRSAYAAEAVCTPSRSSLLTGRYPARSGMASDDPDFRTMMSPAQKTGFPHYEYTFAEGLKDQGYSTALVGKWHLGIGAKGEHLPTDHGFDYFYGMPVSNVQTCGGKNIFKESNLVLFAIVRLWNVWVSMLSVIFLARVVRIIGNKTTLLFLALFVIFFYFGHWYIGHVTLCAPMSCLLYRNEEVIEQPVILDNLTLRFTHEAINYINEQSLKTEKQPWLLKMSYVKVHTALFTSQLFKDKSGVGDFGDNVAELDWSIGKIMEALRKTDMYNNTMVIFTSDNGPYLERNLEAGSSGYVITEDNETHYLKGGKGQNWEGGIRVPTLAYWANKIPHKSIDQPISLMDFYPTILSLSGHPGVTDRIVDGKDLSPILFTDNEGTERIHEFLYHWCGRTLHAVRYLDWKMHFITPIWDFETEHCDSIVICQCMGRRMTYHEKPLLFNMKIDPGENNPIDTNSKQYKEIYNIITNAKEQHESTFTPVFNQLESFPRPWLMPCCNSTGNDCSCYENNNDFEYLITEELAKR